MIEVNNLTKSSVDQEKLKRIVEGVLNKEKNTKNLSIVLVGSARMKGLNKKWRKKNVPTDVLSFSSSKEFPEELGEIVICPEVVKKNAKKYGVSFKKELVKVLIHGVLHLLGYNHEEEGKEEELMEKTQDFYFQQFCSRI